MGVSERPPQLALAVDPACLIEVCERRGEHERRCTFGPLPEPQARDLAALLLQRTDAPGNGGGPWRLAIAGGIRVVSLRHTD